MDLPFLDPTPSGAASNPMPWETPNQESSDDATLNELLALYQTGSEPSPFDSHGAQPPFALDPPASFGQDSPFPPFMSPEGAAPAASDSPFPPFMSPEGAAPAASDSPFPPFASEAPAPTADLGGFGASLVDPFAELLDGPVEAPSVTEATSSEADEIDAIMRDFAAASSASALSDLPPTADPFASIFADEPAAAPVAAPVAAPIAAEPEAQLFSAPVHDPFASIFADEPPAAPAAVEPEPEPVPAPVHDPFASIFADEPAAAPVAAEPAPEPVPAPAHDPFASIFADEPPAAPAAVEPEPEPVPAPVHDPFASIFADEPAAAPVAAEPAPEPVPAPAHDPFASIFADEPAAAPVAAEPEPEPAPAPVAAAPVSEPTSIEVVVPSPPLIEDEKRPDVSPAPAPALVATISVATDVRLDTAENRATALQSAIAEMQGLAAGYDAARSKIDTLYGQLARAAQDKENVDRLSGLLGMLQAARGELGPESDLARQAQRVKDTAQAFLDLICQP